MNHHKKIKYEGNCVEDTYGTFYRETGGWGPSGIAVITRHDFF